MNIWDRLEEQAGHALTVVAPMTAGYLTYICEKCGAYVLLNSDGLQIFHAPPGNPATPDACAQATITVDPETSLKVKLAKRDAADWERLRERI